MFMSCSIKYRFISYLLSTHLMKDFRYSIVFLHQIQVYCTYIALLCNLSWNNIRAGTSNYIPQYLWDVITCPCLWYLLQAQQSWNDVYHSMSHKTCTQFCWALFCCGYMMIHYNDVIMNAMASQITSLRIVFSTAYLDTDQRKHQSSASLAFVQGIHRRLVNSPHKWPVTWKMFPFDGVIMYMMIAYVIEVIYFSIFFMVAPLVLRVIIWLPQCQLNNPEGSGSNQTIYNYDKVCILCIFLGGVLHVDSVYPNHHIAMR